MGGFMGGNVFNQIKKAILKLEGNVNDSSSSENVEDRQTVKTENFDHLSARNQEVKDLEMSKFSNDNKV